MNSYTGHIKEFQSLEEAQRQGYAIEMKCGPDPKCKKCYGLGHVGKNIDTGQYEPCQCCRK